MKYRCAGHVLSIVIAVAAASSSKADDPPPSPLPTDTPFTAEPTAPANSVVRTPVRLDRAHLPRIGYEYYPKESIRNHEQGVCVVKMTVQVDGHIRDVSIARSTGYPRLDEACLKAWDNAQLLPATQNGVPVETTATIPVTWKITRR
jgi:protein TonB